jgi:hypothetical protein
MYTRNSGKRWLTAGLAIAAAGFPAAAAARYVPDAPGSATGTPSCEVLRAVQHLDTGVCSQPARHRPRQVHKHHGHTSAVRTGDRG